MKKEHTKFNKKISLSLRDVFDVMPNGTLKPKAQYYLNDSKTVSKYQICPESRRFNLTSSDLEFLLYTSLCGLLGSTSVKIMKLSSVIYDMLKQDAIPERTLVSMIEMIDFNNKQVLCLNGRRKDLLGDGQTRNEWLILRQKMMTALLLKNSKYISHLPKFSVFVDETEPKFKEESEFEFKDNKKEEE